MSEDPLGVAGGVNLYGYVQGQATGWVDPSGLAKFREGAYEHIVERHCGAVDEKTGQFSPVFTNPATLNYLADYAIINPSGGKLQKNGNYVYFSQLRARVEENGVVTEQPANIGLCGCNGPETSIYAVVLNSNGEVVTMFPADPIYARDNGFAPRP